MTPHVDSVARTEFNPANDRIVLRWFAGLLEESSEDAHILLAQRCGSGAL